MTLTIPCCCRSNDFDTKVMEESDQAKNTQVPASLAAKVTVVLKIVSWYFEPSQPLRFIISGLKQTSFCFPFTLHTSHQTINSQKKNNKISPNTYLHETKHTKTSKTKFHRTSPFGVAPVKKKYVRLGHAGNVDHSINFSIPDFKKVYTKKQKQK